MPRPSSPRLGRLLLSLSLLLGGIAQARAVTEDAPATHGEAKAEAHGADHAKEGGGSNPPILQFKPSLAVSTAIVFLVLLAVLRAFAWKPLMQALHDREHNLEHTLRETEKARDDAARLLAEHKAALAGAADEVRAIMDEARRDAEKTSADIVTKAQSEAEAHRKRATNEIDLARDRALTDIYGRAADLAVSVAGKVLPRELSADDHKKLIDRAIQEIPAAPSGANGHGGRS